MKAPNPAWAEFMRARQRELDEQWPHFVATANKMGRAPLPQCRAWVVLSPTLNAHAALRTSRQAYEIGINAGLILFASRLSALAARHFPFDDDIGERVADDRAAGEDFAALLAPFADFGRFRLSLTFWTEKGVNLQGQSFA